MSGSILTQARSSRVWRWLGLALLVGLSSLATLAPAARAATLTVNSLADNLTKGDGNCTLREAITNANNNSDTTKGDCTAGNGNDAIIFNLSGAGPQTINLTSGLPIISETLFIDGWSQGGPGYTGPPLIELNGATTASGLDIQADNCVVWGLVINRFANAGIHFSNGASNNWAYGNYIGTGASGTVDLGNTGSGVLLSSGAANNIIGNNSDGINDTAERNLICCNDRQGGAITANNANILITDSGTNGNIVAGNYIGTDVTGAAVIGTNGGTRGVMIFAGAQHNTIGGAVAASRNIIAGHQHTGIEMAQGGVNNNQIMGNYIGPDVTGTTALGNGIGVQIFAFSGTGPQHNIIGTNSDGANDSGERNIISGNTHGVIIINTGALGNVVAGNYIGTDSSGVADLGNSGVGIFIGDAANNTIGGVTTAARNVISANKGNGIQLQAGSNWVLGNYIGVTHDGSTALGNSLNGITLTGNGNNIGMLPGAGNVIAFNNGAGVSIIAGTGNRVTGNTIFANMGLGLDLGADGVNPIGPNPGAGPNNLQNFPVITAALASSGTITLTGSLTSTPSTNNFTLEFFYQADCDPSGHGEGQANLGSLSLNTDSAGQASFTASFDHTVPVGNFITATATDPNGHTSEFSACRRVNGPPASFRVNTPADTLDANLGDGVCADLGNACSLRAAIAEANLLTSAEVYLDAPGPYLLNAGQLIINSPITIHGHNQTVDADFTSRFFEVTSSGHLTLEELTLREGSADDGGAILVGADGNLKLVNSMLTQNIAGNYGGGVMIAAGGTANLINSTLSYNVAFAGGGLFNDNGALNILNSTISGNSATVAGGIANQEGSLNILNSTISANTAINNPPATGTAGGIAIVGGTLNMANSTISGNSTTNHGGGLYNEAGTANLTQVTITNNTADFDNFNGGKGGGIFHVNGTTTLKNSLLAGNSAGVSGSSPDCFGAVSTASYNLIGDNTGCPDFPAGRPNANHDLAGTGSNRLDPLLASPAGRPAYYPLQAGSPAIDQVPLASCTFSSGAANPLFSHAAPVTTDQRGGPRPAGASCDIGAFEFLLPTLHLTKMVDDHIPGPGQRITYTITLSNSGDSHATSAVVSDTLPLGLTLAGPVRLDPPGAGTPGSPPILASGLTITVGQQITLTFPVTVAASLAAGQIITNTAGVTSSEVATPVLGAASLTVVSQPAITITKTANVTLAEVGDIITYTYWLTNTGNLPLDLVSVVDDRLGPVPLAQASLAPDAGTWGSLTYTVVESDLPGPLVNTASVTGTLPGGAIVTATATASVTLQSTSVLYLPLLLKN